MKHSNNHIGRITIFFIIVAATLGIAMAGGLVRWQGIADLFKGDDTAKTAKVETATKPSGSVNYAHTTAFSGMPFMLSVEGCSVTGEAGSVTESAEITVTAIDSLPPLAAGMVNVTRGHAGYRLSPAGLRFARPVSVELGYDSLLLPKGHSTREIRTFLYNSEKRHWEALPRDSVMEGSQNIVSQSKQAGEMINAIVQLPELPESKAFTPTMLTELEAAHPATGITMMEPPAANSQGTANLSYPIAVPAGRNGLQPNLSVSYSSEAGNGLLGMGWDMQLPAITVDSKWGVPRYDAANETECYSYNGQELLPSPRYMSRWEKRSGNGMKVFRLRTEGAFDSIVRYGDSPKNYWWVVTDKSGTKYYYGSYSGYAAATTADALLKDKNGNIASWPLCRVEDMDGNSMSYFYSIREQSEGGAYLGRQLWLESIRYTDNRQAGEVGKYTLFFGSGGCPQAVSGGGVRQHEGGDGPGEGENRGDRSETALDENGNGGGEGGENGDPGSGNCNCDLNIKVVKTDSCTGDPIEGVGFDLVCDDGNSAGEQTDVNGEAGWMLNSPCGKTYTLTETWAHTGYRSKQVSFTFMVDENCNIIPLSDMGIDRIEFGSFPSPDITVYVSNKPECSATVRLHKRNARTGRALDNAVFDLVHEQGNRSDTTGSSGEIVWQLDEPCSEYMVSEIRAPYGYRFRNATALIATSEQCQLFVTDTTGIDSFRIVGGSELHLYVGNMPYNVNPFHPKADSIENAVMGPRPQQPSGFYSGMNECDCDDGYPYDLRTDARLGFMRSSKEKLRRIMVFYKDSLVRSYSFCYGSDIFGRAQLRSIRQYGADYLDEPYTHTFSYYHEVDSVRLNLDSQVVANAGRNQDGMQLSARTGRAGLLVSPMEAHLLPAQSVLDATRQFSFGGGVGGYFGLGYNVTNHEPALTLDFDYSHNSGSGRATLADVTGDGLPDRVFVQSGQVYYKSQLNSGGFNATADSLRKFSAFLRDKGDQYSLTLGANAGGHGGIGGNYGTHRTTTYLSDVNGDGLPDVVSGGGARAAVRAYPPFNMEFGGCGLPRITEPEGYYPQIRMKDIPTFTEEEEETVLPAYDLVRVWRSNGGSPESIASQVIYSAELTDELVPGAAAAIDTVIISVEWYDTNTLTQSAQSVLLQTDMLTLQHPAVNRNLTCSLSYGDMLFFRARSPHGRQVSRLLRWSPRVVKSDTVRDPNGLLFPDADSAGRNQLLQGDGLFICPFTGTVQYDDYIDLNGLRDTATCEMWHNHTLKMSRKTTGNVSCDMDVLKGDTLKFFFRCGSNVDLAAHPWFPKIYYTDVYYDTAVTDTTHFAVTDQESFAFWPLPRYDFWDGFLNTREKINYTDSVTVQLADGMNASDSISLVVKHSGQTVFRKLFSSATDKVVIGVSPGYYLEGYVPEGKNAWKYLYANPFSTSTKNHHGAPNIHIRFHGDTDPLHGRFYGGWSQFQYRHDDLAMMDMVKLGRLANAAANTATQNQEIERLRDEYKSKEGDTTALRNIMETDNLLSSNHFKNDIFDCLPLTANGETRRHEGLYPNSWIKGDTLSLGCIPAAMQVTEEDGRDTAFSPDENPASGGGMRSGSGTSFSAKATDKVSHTLGASASAGIWKVGANSGFSRTKTVRDFMDLNGDGVPDFIDKDKVCYSLPCRSEGAVRWESGWRGAFADNCSSRSYSISTGMGYTAGKEKLIEITRISNKGRHTTVADGSVSGNASTARDFTVMAMIDMNGDGLPDKVDSKGNVRLNKGYGFMEPQKWDSLEKIGVHTSVTGSANAGISNLYNNASMWKASYSGGVSLTVSENSQKWTLADMNGDGLPDLVHRHALGRITYQLNTGSGFESRNREWKPAGLSNLLWGSSATISASLKATFGGAFFGCKVGGTPSVNGSATHTNSRLQIMDFDGDGIPDLLKSTGSGSLKVCYAHLGRTGLLKTVTYPLGGSVTMDYEMTPADVHHSRRWVMTKVMTHDSLPGDGCDSLRTSIRYDHGYYDRTEREFLGFAVVVVNDVDGNNDTLRTTIRYYDNRSVHAKGSLLCEALVNIRNINNITDTVKWLVTTCSYATDSVGERMGGTRAVFHRLTRRQTCFYEGLPQAQITAWEEFDYENTHGNVVRQRQGSTDQTTVEANISYHAQYNNNHCVNMVSSVEIPGFKKRTTEVDNKGHYTVFRDWYSSTQNLATRLQYDNYGNVITMRGPNTTVHYTYDSYVHSYPTAITDTFGITSQMQNYDFRFGIPRTIVDQAGSQMLYTLDSWGRTVTIQGPKEIAAGKPFTIRHTYTGREPAPAGTTRQRAVSMAMTEHYDPQHSNIPNSSDNPIRTYTYCDGLGRIVQTRKEAEINGVEKLVVSGHTVVDALGRTVATYYPTEKSLTDVLFAFDPDQSAPASTVTYDILDRPLVQTAPDASTSTFIYGFAYNNDLGKMLFSTTTTDANNHSSIELKDVSGKPWVIHPSGQQPVYFEYNPVGDNTKVYSSLPNDWERNYTYDMLGRRLTYQEGELVESLTYNGGNLSAHSQSWLENGTAQTKTTTYHYNAHRLDSVSYDDALTTIYHYDQYGRVDSLYDESGVMCYTYGNMGEITKETRIYALPFLNSPLALTTQFRYDSWGRVDSIFYPDGERLKYQYDLGGQLKSITNNSNYTYLDNVTYDRFGAKVSQEYGNGLVTSYTYDSYTRRLSQITVADNSNNPYGDIQYGYDPVGNVTQANSTCPWLQNHTFSETFTYDASDQLTSATESQNQSYQLAVTYGNWGKINSYSLTQTDLQSNTSQSEAQSYTYPATNSIGSSQTLFAPVSRTIQGGQHPHSVQSFTFGINGSLRKREVQAQASNTEYYLFNSAANMKAYSNNGLDFAYYGYNAANTRAYKLSMLNQNQWVNGQPQPLNLQLQSAMFYPNAYLNFNHNGEYTKHYYNGAERIASRLGTVTLNNATTSNARLTTRSGQLEDRFRNDIRTLVYAGDIPMDMPPEPVSATLQTTGTSSDIFYYHTNHLGSTAYVTDQNQTVTQGFLYAPFGEITTEYNTNFYNNVLPKYSFNAKELDEETGMYYYEARYYKPPVFTSRDPMFEKYFWMTPYAYCANNPVKYVDPSGEELGDPPYTGSGWGHNMRRFIANTFNVNSNINNVFEAGLNSILQSNNVNVTGQALDKIKKDPAMKSLEEKYLKSIQSDSRFGKEEFQMNYSNPIQFGGKRAPESMREQCKDPFNPKYKDTWKVAANELTWLVRSVTVKTVINVTKDGDITMNHSFKDKLDLRPSEGRSKEYNRVTSIMGFIYHDVLGGNDEMTVSASWSNSFPLKKPTNTSNR